MKQQLPSVMFSLQISNILDAALYKKIKMKLRVILCLCFPSPHGDLLVSIKSSRRLALARVIDSLRTYFSGFLDHQYLFSISGRISCVCEFDI